MKDLVKMEKRYRLEIEGLRAVAIMLVVMYHIWFGRVSGGIDVFFVLSGFLVTTTLIGRIEKNGRIKLFDFLFGLLKRLLPQAVIVLVTVTIASLFIMQQSQWQQIKEHVVATFFYIENWRLAIDAVDYLAQGQQVSPLQHFWSLSVQGQIYLIWPVLFIGCYIVLVKLCKWPLRLSLLLVFSTVFVSSLTYSIYKTATNQPWAYFDTFARMWEFSIGGLLVLLLPYLKFNKIVNFIVGWLGLAIILLTGFAIQVSTVFPGYMALVPICGALFVLISAENSGRFSAKSFLSQRLFIGLGSLSYGIYLWHWPLLRFYEETYQVDAVPFLDGCLIIVATIALSFISTNLVEKPIRQIDHRKQARKLGVVVVMLTLLVGATYGVSARYMDEVASSPQQFTPSFQEALADFPTFYDDKQCLAKGSVEVVKCSYGVTDDPDYTVALVGGSHSGHWFPALELLASELNFQLDLYNHDGCRFTNQDPDNHLTPECIEWNANLIDVLKADRPDLVFTTASLNKRDHVPIGYVGQWTELEGVTTIFAIRDNPRMVEHSPQCLEREGDPIVCGVPRVEALSAVLPWENTADLPSNVIYADLSDEFCDEDMCPAAKDGVIIYRDDNHITATFSKILAEPLKLHLQEALASLQEK